MSSLKQCHFLEKLFFLIEPKNKKKKRKHTTLSIIIFKDSILPGSSSWGGKDITVFWDKVPLRA